MLIALIGLFGWLYLLFYALNQEHSWGYNMLSTPSLNSKDRWTDRCSVGYDEDNGFAKNYTLPCEAYKLSKNSSIANGVLNIKISLDGEVLPSQLCHHWIFALGKDSLVVAIMTMT